ncbi:MAG: DUF1844 domain-containing protein [Sedimentisphaerales bacterium]|nr:DUF1844 domain-containing protein [Sedimentisphaerales bacterium]
MAEEEKKKKEKKIIVDEDWKKEAQKEKEVLASQEQSEQSEEQVGKQKGRRSLPPGDFAALISMLVTQAFFALGLIHVEGQEEKEPDLEMARYNIDMLSTLEEKTKGNLSEEEDKVLQSTLSQVRMAYVKVSEKK